MKSTPKNQRNSELVLIKLIIISLCIKVCCACDNQIKDESALDKELKNYVDRVLKTDRFSIIPGVEVEKLGNFSAVVSDSSCEKGRSSYSFEDYVRRRLDQYAETHVVSVNFEQTARFLTSSGDATGNSSTDGSGKSSFLAGFSMGLLAFFLKKLMLPVFLGAQLIKSVLIAMFLPTLLGGLGRLAGKGLSTFSGLSTASTGLNRHQQLQQMEDFEFKDSDPYNNEEPPLGADFNDDQDSLTLNTLDSSSTASPNSRLGFANKRIYTAPTMSDNYYLRRPQKKTDYKVFHKIPSSSLLLTSYDPFYSPLLSRLDAVFQQWGLAGQDKGQETERCRERLVCLMYANPAKYAPYSNLVSAQLSRELNELRKPTSDNPEILRFFRYMKAAKDGQDGETECPEHGGCSALTAHEPSPALLTTYNEINKLVEARKISK
ncbi:uncharacterized protein LOC126742383 [Anthonomus grandis grandis]|uniref:uncharacterized protein LOC126742383 n=1 Tax=Anthonomus grandis grandis TaxID=2921223 RepID=UPI0021659FB1|nr:uncharacterized protein LOC126742383 [Anthonomus grandis grandis]